MDASTSLEEISSTQQHSSCPRLTVTFKRMELEGGGGGGGVLDRVVMERKTQEEGFAHPDRAVTSALKNVCV